MTDAPPFEILLRGPAAVAEWLAKQDRDNKRKAESLLDRHRQVLIAAGIDPASNPDSITSEQIAIGLGACLLTASIIAYAAKDGMRGPARDSLADLIDGCFDTIDSIEAASQPFRDAVDALRKATR